MKIPHSARDQRRAHEKDSKRERQQSQEPSRHMRTSKTSQQNIPPRIVSSGDKIQHQKI